MHRIIGFGGLALALAASGPTQGRSTLSPNASPRLTVEGNPIQGPARKGLAQKGATPGRSDEGGSAPASGDSEPLKLEPLEITSGAPAPGAPLLQSSQIDVLKGREKERQEATSLGESLEHLPGVDTIGAGPQAGKPVIRGLSGNRVRILSGGLGIDHQQFGTRHAPNLDPFLSDRVEVVRGVSSLLYGSGALGGAVNVQPLAIPFAAEKEPRMAGETLTRYATNNNQIEGGLRAGTGTHQLGAVGGFVRRSGGNITTPDDPTFFPPPPSDPAKRDAPAHTGELDFTDFDQLNAVLGVGTRGAWGEVIVHYNRWRSEHNFLLPPPAGNRPPGVEEGIGQDLADDRIQVAADLPIPAGFRLKSTFMWQNNRRRSNAPGNPRSALFDGTIDVEFDQYTARLEGEHEELLAFDGGTLGLEALHRDQVSRGNTQLAPGGEVDNVAFFALEERQTGALMLQGGLRFDHREVTAEEDETAARDILFSGRSSEEYDAVTGSLGASYRLTPNLTLAANLARGFRAPTLFELFANGVHGGVAAVQQGDPKLDPERSLDASLSLRWRSERLQASANVYRNRIRDYIFLRDTGASDPGSGLPVFRYDQADAVLRGLDLEVTGRPIHWLELSAQASLVDGENRETNRELPLLPANKLRFSVAYKPANWGPVANPYLRLGVRHAFEKEAVPGEPFAQFDAAPFGTASTEAYTLLDLGAGLEWRAFGNRPVRLDLAVQNLLNASYRDFLDTYKGYALSPGRDVRVTLRVPFGS